MNIKPSAAIRQNYNEIANLCKTTHEPVFLTKNGEGDLVVMDMETYSRREKLLKLQEKLMNIEADRVAGGKWYTVEELDMHLSAAIEGVANGIDEAV